MAVQPPIRIFMLEDHPVFSDGLRLGLESQPDMRVVATVSTASEALKRFPDHRPDIVLLDERLPDASGIEVAEQIRRIQPTARIIMLTSAAGDGTIRHALQAGVKTYLLKTTSSQELLAAIRAVHAGRRFVSPIVADRLAQHRGSDELTPRELEVLRLVRDGNSNRQIALTLSIADVTVSFHIRNCVEKLSASDRNHAVILAIRRGLLEL